MKTLDNQSSTLFNEAKKLIPGGVNSPVRSFQSVSGTPLFIKQAQGATLWTEDNQKFIDFVGSFGPAILGHAHPNVLSAIHQASLKGLSFGAPHRGEINIVNIIQRFMPHLENIRFVNSGTEACMTAVRLARGVTNKQKIIKFKGGYHGHVDALLVESGSGTLQHGTPTSPGIPTDTTKDTLVCRYNDLQDVADMIALHPHDIAAIMVEPVAGNMNFIPPKPEFLSGLRELCNQHQALLIFDEVMTGFRIHPGGAKALFEVTPDITTLGKIIGGGLPVGAIGGPRSIMSQLSPEGPIYQAGTLSGNPITLASGIATLSILEQQDHEYLSNLSHQIIHQMKHIASQHDLPFQGAYLGGMLGFFFQETLPTHYDAIESNHVTIFKQFHQHMLENGCYFAPSAFEVCMLSFAHNQAMIDHMLHAFENFCLNFNTKS
ncbi:MAG: glutamate-1-semialdehyde 2,1-aminomutase [Candidatus Comchoanobacterales bacterium]